MIAKSLKDFNVLILEKNKSIAPKDSGIVSKRFFEHYDRKFVQHEITKMELVAPGGRSFFLQDEAPFAFILHRERFASSIMKEAKRNADIVHEAFVSAKTEKERCVVRTNGGEYEGRMVVGCDGAMSSVRKSMGIAPMKLSLGVMVRKSGIKKGCIKVFFNKSYSPDFFSWIIPQTDEYGLMAGARAREFFERFRHDMCLNHGRLYAYMVPTGMTRSYSERCILVGDACGQNKPLTGGGIIFSLIGARHAAEAIRKAVACGRFSSSHLSEYEKRWKSEISLEIRKQLLVRRAYFRMSNSDIDRIFSDFGSHMEKLRGFDYDKFSRSWRHLPKVKLAKFTFLNLPRLF
jgi:flavin-dependent dehydrogenase